MRMLRYLALLIVMLATTVGTVSADLNDWRTFTADVSGSPEVPARDTPATGEAIFNLSQNGTELRYELRVDDIQDVVAAHLHLAPVGSNGGIVVHLYRGLAPAGSTTNDGRGRTQGVLAKGTVTEANLIGALAGLEMSDLIDAIEAGNIYVNIHTNDLDPSTPDNTGPGNFPGGEIRGQVSED
jgi:hypothetical protein